MHNVWMAKYSEELKGVARALYLKHYTPQEIASELNLPNRRIVYYWAEKHCWAELLSHESTEDALNRRIQTLTLREGKSELELRELDSLVAHLVKLRAQHNKHQEKLTELKRTMAVVLNLVNPITMIGHVNAESIKRTILVN